MSKQYVEIAPKTKGSRELIFLTNGDIIHKGGTGTVYEGQWFFINKQTKFVRRLPKATTYEEALEAYQQDTGNCIVGL